MARGGTPEWKKGKHTTTYGTKAASTTNYKNLKMHTNTVVLEKLKSDLTNLALNHVRYGIVDQVTYPAGDPNGRAGMYVAEIWKRLEYGHVMVTPTGGRAVIPPRPMFAVHLQTKGKEVFKKTATEFAIELFSGAYIRDTSLVKLGVRMQNALKFTLLNYKGFVPLQLPKNSPRSNTDFYNDTGFLIKNVSYRVMPSGIDLNSGSGGTNK